MEKEGYCCFCGKKYANYGNDIWPIVTSNGGRCCDECNMNIVAPTRIAKHEQINANEIKKSIHEKNKEYANCIQDFLPKSYHITLSEDQVKVLENVFYNNRSHLADFQYDECVTLKVDEDGTLVKVDWKKELEDSKLLFDSIKQQIQKEKNNE